MALRTKVVDVAGQKLTIANLQLRPLRTFGEAVLAAKSTPKEQVGEAVLTLEAAKRAAVLASLQRADPAYKLEQLEELDGDDLKVLLEAVMDWSGQGPGKATAEPPAGEPQSP